MLVDDEAKQRIQMKLSDSSKPLKPNLKPSAHCRRRRDLKDSNQIKDPATYQSLTLLSKDVGIAARNILVARDSAANSDNSFVSIKDCQRTIRVRMRGTSNPSSSLQ